MNRAKVIRRKTLNVIYFVDSERTKSIHLPVSTVVVIFSALVGMLLWTLLSAYAGYVALNDRARLLNYARQVRNTLFDYETRFEGVYESVYPNEAGKEVAAATEGAAVPQAAAPSPKPVAAQIPPAHVPEAAAAEPPKEVAQQPTEATGALAPSAPATEQKLKVNVDNPIFRKSTNALELKVDINNQDAKNKAEGYVWALATYKPDSGSELFVAAPKGMQIGANGETGDPHNAQRYAIQFHKPKNFIFDAPSPGSGKFTQVRIVLQDYSGQRSEFKFPISE